MKKKTETLSQTELAMLLNVNQSTISKAISAGVITRGADWLTQTREYIAHLIEVAAGRRGEGDLDIVAETARLKKAQADRILIEIKEVKGEVLHVSTIVTGLASNFSLVRNRLLGLPSKIKSLISDIKMEDFKKITAEVHQTLTELSQLHLPREVIAKMKGLEEAGWGDIGFDPNLEQGEISDGEKEKGRSVNGSTDPGVRGGSPPRKGKTSDDRVSNVRAVDGGRKKHPGRHHTRNVNRTGPDKATTGVAKTDEP